jgi:GTPase SAR1 family protein
MTESKYREIARIAIIGSAGVGKTSLLEALFKMDRISSQYQKIPEQVRVLCAERGYTSPYQIDDDVNEFREEILLRQIQSESASQSFIADRSTIDAWVYFMLWSWNMVEIDRAESFYQAAYKQAQQYDLLIYLPIMFEAKDDNFRWANATYQKQVDRLLLAMVDSWTLRSKLYTVQSLKLEDRVEEISSLKLGAGTII